MEAVPPTLQERCEMMDWSLGLFLMSSFIPQGAKRFRRTEVEKLHISMEDFLPKYHTTIAYVFKRWMTAPFARKQQQLVEKIEAYKRDFVVRVVDFWHRLTRAVTRNFRKMIRF